MPHLQLFFIFIPFFFPLWFNNDLPLKIEHLLNLHFLKNKTLIKYFIESEIHIYLDRNWEN